MAATIRIKRSGVAGNPTTLAAGELAYSSLADNGSNGGDRLYVGTGTETSGNAANHEVIGGKYFVGQINAATNANTASTIVKRDASGDFSAGTITATLSGLASSATILATSRNINGTAFNGSADITVTAAAGTLTGTTLNSGVTASSLTSVGTISTGTWSGSFGAVSGANLTSLTAGNLTGTISSTVLGNSSVFIGTTSVALNRGTGNLALTGITSVTLPGATSGSVQIIPTATAGTGTVLTLPATTGTVITTGDTGTVTNTMLAGSIANTKLTNSSVTVGTTSIALGASSTTLAGLTSVSSTGFTGALTGNASTATALAAGRTIAITGDLSYTSPSFDGSGNVTAAGTLATVNSNTGSFGSASSIPIITVNAKGLITAVSTATISSSAALTVSDGTASDVVTVGTDTLTFAGGTGVTTAVTNNQVSFAIGQAVATTSNVTFNNLTVSGTLVVNGTTTTVNSTVVTLDDPIITLGGDTAPTVDDNKDRGVEFRWHNGTAAKVGFFGYDDSTGYLTFIPDATNTSEVFSGTQGDIQATNFRGALVGNASTATALATGRTIAITGDLTYTSPSFDGSGNVTAAGTLATVNSNTGSFGSSTSVPSFTVNGKGLITAASTNAIPTATSSVLGLASFNATDFLVTAGAVTVASVDGGTY